MNILARYSVYGEQDTILNDWIHTDKNCMDIIHAGAGKTHMAAIALPIFATDRKYHKGKDVVFIAPTMDMVKTNVWHKLVENCIKNHGVQPKDINNGDMTIRFQWIPDEDDDPEDDEDVVYGGTRPMRLPRWCFIRMKSAEIRDRIRGLNAGIILADEASLFSKEVLQELSNRLRPNVGSTDTPGRFIIISTPKGAGPLKDMFDYATLNPDKWVVRHLNYLQMRSGNLAFINEQKQLLSPLKFAQDYLCSWDSVEDQFYYAWNKTYISDTEDKFGDLYIGMDFNKRKMCAVVAQVTKMGKRTGRIEIIKAYAIPDCSTMDMAKAIREDFPARNLYAVIDMSGTQVNRDTTSTFGTTDRTILEEFGFIIVNTKKSNPLISDTDNSSNAFISRGALTVPPTETLLIDALNTYHYEDGARKKLVKSMDVKYCHIDGLGDALRYLIHHCFPMVHDQEKLNNFNGTDFTPGAEYMKQSPLYPGGPSYAEILNGWDSSDDDDVISYG